MIRQCDEDGGKYGRYRHRWPLGSLIVVMSTADITSMESALRDAPDPEIVALEALLRSAQLAADVNVLDLLIVDRLLFTRRSARDQGAGPRSTPVWLCPISFARYTRSWAREGGERWRVVGGHISEVGSLGGA